MVSMEEAIEQLQNKDTKERLAGVERLQTLLEQSRKGLTAGEVGNLVDASLVLLKDNNFRVAQGTLQALASAAALAGEHLKPHFNSLLPAIVERLGDSKQPVRDAGRRLLLALMEISSPSIIVDRSGNYALQHKSWRVREEFARTVASAINLFAATELPFQRLLLPFVLQLLEDSNSSVREAAMLCIEEMYRQGGAQLKDELQRHQVRPGQLKDISARFEKIEPVRRSLEILANSFPTTNFFSAPSQHVPAESKSSHPVLTSNRRSSPKPKPAFSDSSSAGGDNDAVEKPIDPVRVYSDKELTKEVEKAASMLTEKVDWSVRMTAMQRIEGLVVGGAADYACFPLLLKQLVAPLTVQLADRRSSIVKQACQLINLMSKELLGDFEIFAETFIPVLFKLVVITVLVIAESADTCIKTMLGNCRVTRVIPRMIECAKHDRNAVLRARCCEYALLVLERWSDSPELQRSIELYEDLIKCCVGDAVSEVRSTARMCYRVYLKCWPDRARRLFVTFDASLQRLLNEEEGGFQKRYSSPSIRDRGPYQQQQHLKQGTAAQNANNAQSAVNSASSTNFGNPSSVIVDRSSVALQGIVNNQANNSYERRSVESTERTLESVLQASQQQVNAIENMLRGVEVSDKATMSASVRALLRDQAGGSYRKIHAATSAGALRVGVDPPSARDPPQPASALASTQVMNRTPSLLSDVAALSYFSKSIVAGSGVGATANLASHQSYGLESARATPKLGRSSSVVPISGSSREQGISFLPSNSAKRVPLTGDRPPQGHVNGESGDIRGPKRVLKADMHGERGGPDVFYNGLPGFQRPLLRQSASGRSSGSSRSSGEDNHVLIGINAYGEVSNYMDGLMTLNDALSEGLSPNTDWSARVAAFTYLRKLIQQGPKGLQDVAQSFDRIMKLFAQHLDDPHHKVAQAALSTLAELVPACRKSFEAYLERIIPHVFARLVDPKEMIRQLGTTVLEIVGSTYSIDSLLPALLRSLDEQRSPKAKIAVIDFAIAAFAKLAMSGEGAGGTGLLKLWLAKLAPLANDKNPKLKETAVNGIISVYCNFDSTTVLNFLLGLSIEEQSILRRALKQYTPRIEVDLMSYLQNRSQRARSKPIYDHSDSASATSESYTGRAYTTLTSNQFCGGYTSASINSDSGKKWGNSQPEIAYSGYKSGAQRAGLDNNSPYRSLDSANNPSEFFGHGKCKDAVNEEEENPDKSVVWVEQVQSHRLAMDSRHAYGGSPLLDSQSLINLEQRFNGGKPSSVRQTHAEPRLNDVLPVDTRHANQVHPIQTESQPEYQGTYLELEMDLQSPSSQHSGSSMPNILLQMTNWGTGKPSKERCDALHQLCKLSCANDKSIWSQYFNQILTVVLEALDDPDTTVKELALRVIAEMIRNQRDGSAESTELLLEKLLHSTQDLDAKVCKAADDCLTTVLTELDPYRCLTVVVPLLVSENQKTLVTCIAALTKLVSRLPSEELMAQLPSFLPALFDAFGNQNADVRKTVVFCLVDIYIVLGKAFVPYLGSLSNTQLRLVTIYANRISQARTGVSLESSQL